MLSAFHNALEACPTHRHERMGAARHGNCPQGRSISLGTPRDTAGHDGCELALIPLGYAWNPRNLTPVTIDDERVGDPERSQLTRKIRVRCQRRAKMRVLRFPELIDGRPAILVDRNRQDDKVLGVSRGEALERRHLSATGRAPGGPQVHDYDPTTQT